MENLQHISIKFTTELKDKTKATATSTYANAEDALKDLAQKFINNPSSLLDGELRFHYEGREMQYAF